MIEYFETKLTNIEKLLFAIASHIGIEVNLTTQIKQKRGAERMPRPLKYGQGSITERRRINKNGTVCIWYEARWTDEYGKRRTRTTKTKAEAYNVLLQFNKRSMRSPRKQVKTFGEYFYEWYNTFRRPECGEARNSLNLLQINRIPKEIMNKPLGQINVNEIQAYLNTIEKPNPKMQTKELIAACIKHAFNSGHIKSNIGLLLKADKPKAPEKPILPKEREKEFIDLLPEKYQGYAIGLIYTGVRLGESMRLNENWQTDIDYENEIVKIRETKSLRQKDLQAGITYVIRQIPLLPELAKLKFPLPTCKQKTINKNFTKACEKFGIHLTPHCMRHTFISRCNELEITPSIIMGIVGHKTERMTMHYTHNTTELVDREYKKLKQITPMCTPIRSKREPKDVKKP